MTIDGINSPVQKDHNLVQELKIMHQKVTHLEQTQRDLCDRIRHYQEQQKILQQQNHDLEISLKTIIEGTTDAIFVKDNQGRYVVVNSACAKFLGYQIEEIIGNDDYKLLPPEVAQQAQAADKQVVSSGKTLHIEEEVPTIHGIRIFQSTKDVCQDEHGNAIGLVGIARDITPRKQAEEALKESEAKLRAKAQQLELTLQKLQNTQAQLIQSEKMSSLGQMVAGIAHEINNPANFIHGNLIHVGENIEDLLDLISLWQQQYPESTPEIAEKIEEIDLEFLQEDLPEIFTSMKMGTQRIRNIVLSLRNFSRLDETGIKAVNLHEGIENTLLILNYRLQDKITLVKEYGELPPVECHGAELNQVWMHLLTNAIDAFESSTSSQNPQITITTQTLNPQEVAIQITDNGVGIPNKVQNKIFDPFFTTKPVGKGTGLGLSICYQIIQQHGGEIQVNSQVGKGTQLQVILPVQFLDFSS